MLYNHDIVSRDSHAPPVPVNSEQLFTDLVWSNTVRSVALDHSRAGESVQLAPTGYEYAARFRQEAQKEFSFFRDCESGNCGA